MEILGLFFVFLFFQAQEKVREFSTSSQGNSNFFFTKSEFYL